MEAAINDRGKRQPGPRKSMLCAALVRGDVDFKSRSISRMLKSDEALTGAVEHGRWKKYDRSNFSYKKTFMSLSVADVREMLRRGEIGPSYDDVSATGVLSSSDGNDVQYSLYCGWDIAKAHCCDRDWGSFNVALLDFIAENFAEGEARNKVLAQAQLEDFHWDWFKKSIHCKTEEYIWFFLAAEGVFQGACLVYQPKESALQSGNIFYIDFVAVAPWNRENIMGKRRFLGVGTRLIRHAVEHCISSFQLVPGFSLHALPKAISFYRKIGMVPCAKFDKPNLPYFEMPEQGFKEFVGASK